MTVSSRHDSDTTHMECQQYSCLNKACIITILVYMPTWMGEISKGFTPEEES